MRIETEGETRTARLLWAVMLGDLVSLQLAGRRGVDPAPVEVIDELKDGSGDRDARGTGRRRRRSRIRGLTKVYGAGETAVRALDGVDLRDRDAARWSRSWARRARARARCCTCSARWRRRRGGTIALAGRRFDGPRRQAS